MTATSIKQPFQSGSLMDISRCIERLEIAAISVRLPEGCQKRPFVKVSVFWITVPILREDQEPTNYHDPDSMPGQSNTGYPV
jgi:hypothetical protein